jgi:phospholipid-binding lipoprotein MlaA
VNPLVDLGGASRRTLALVLGLGLSLLAAAPTARAMQTEDATLPVPVGVREATPAEAATTEHAGDPFQKLNRGVFVFNDKVDGWVLRPVAIAWDKVIPEPVEHGLDNAFENIRFPIHLVNNALQGRIDGTGTTLLRFLINSTVGIAGFFDVAAKLGMPRQNADFGQTLGVWGAPPGPYIVWPILGSSNVRDSVGMVVDGYINVTGLFVDWPYLAAQRVLQTVNSRALLLDDIDRAREASFDFYVAVRAAYDRRRADAIAHRRGPTGKEEENLYFPDPTEDGAVGASGAAAPTGAKNGAGHAGRDGTNP